jgi:hypothetical protein
MMKECHMPESCVFRPAGEFRPAHWKLTRFFDGGTIYGFGKDKDLCEGRGRDIYVGEMASIPEYGFESMTDQYFYEKKFISGN